MQFSYLSPDFVVLVILQLSFSPTTPGWSHFRLVALLSTILILSGFMFIVCVGVGFFGGLNTFAFMAAEVSISVISSMTCITDVAIGNLPMLMPQPTNLKRQQNWLSKIAVASDRKIRVGFSE